MKYTFPPSELTDLASSLGWTPPMYWEIESAWKSNCFDYPKTTRNKYQVALGIDDNSDGARAINIMDDVTVADRYVSCILRMVPIEDRGLVFIEEIEQNAEAFIWEHWTSCLRGRMQAAVTGYICEAKHNFSPVDEEVYQDIDEMEIDLHTYEMAKIPSPNTYILINGNKRELNVHDSTAAFTIDEALKAFEYGPGGIENHWEHMIDQGIVDGDADFDAEHPAFNERALYVARCFYGLEDDQDPEEHGNYIDGDSNSAYKLIEITPSGKVTSYPK